MELLNDKTLERSSVVANSRMNRQRGAVGVNSYEKEIGLSPIAFLTDRIDSKGSAAWLDICCGRGRALIDAANAFRELEPAKSIELCGVDLVDAFDPLPPHAEFLQFQVASLHQWQPSDRYDLITCIHGLHYVGDKLRIIELAAGALTDDGVFYANLDLANLHLFNGQAFARQIKRRFQDCGFVYNPRKHLLSCQGRKSPSFGYRYVGADDTAGPNCTKQEAVNSYYDDG